MKFLNLIFFTVEIKELNINYYILQLVEGHFFFKMNYLGKKAKMKAICCQKKY